MASQETEIKEYGWTAVPHSLSAILEGRTNPNSQSSPLTIEAIGLPDTRLAKEVLSYARSELPLKVFNHSLRVYYYGRAIAKQHFPTFSHSAETLLLTALLHDIGTTPANINSTFLSFEFSGALIAHGLLSGTPTPTPSSLSTPALSTRAPKAQVESVVETIIRHQDLGDVGRMTELTALVHFATIFDNAGANAALVHPETIRAVVEAYPRDGWTACFADVLRVEMGTKPWANSTRVDGFIGMVEGNEVMRPYGN